LASVSAIHAAATAGLASASSAVRQWAGLASHSAVICSVSRLGWSAAADYDTLLAETVGVGQSETLVAEMTDTFLLLVLARTGDQLLRHEQMLRDCGKLDHHPATSRSAGCGRGTGP
jgi:hypothetical protein